MYCTIHWIEIYLTSKKHNPAFGQTVPGIQQAITLGPIYAPYNCTEGTMLLQKCCLIFSVLALHVPRYQVGCLKLWSYTLLIKSIVINPSTPSGGHFWLKIFCLLHFL